MTDFEALCMAVDMAALNVRRTKEYLFLKKLEFSANEKTNVECRLVRSLRSEVAEAERDLERAEQHHADMIMALKQVPRQYNQED